MRITQLAHCLHARVVRIIIACLIGGSLLADSTLAQTPPTPSDTTIKPGDTITLRIWREPDLSGEFPVHEDGIVVFPRLGPVQVTGMPITELKRQLREEFEETLRNPSIEIGIMRRITVAGEVRSPGVYQVDPSMTVAEAMALAGGPTGNADRDRIILVRNGQEHEIDFDGTVDLQTIDIQSKDQLFVPQRNWLVRNLPLISSILGITSTLVLLLTR